MKAPTSNGPDHPLHVGPYKLLDLLGEGGMGEVWLAEQSEPVHRRVALKIIKLGMDTKQVLARLEAERQALAVMDHPNIASFHDGGATEGGRPYFVMELVQGVSITEYCDTHRLSTHERIRLFTDVCRAVQHAHQKGVIHRDLKPSNVLVAVKEAKPVVKIIDFGIAKALGHELTDRTLVTRVGQMIGTPEYMSPEQAEMTGLDVDTRTDIYALGVMLYELLVGALPFDLRARADQAIRYAIRETEVPKPSTRLTSLGETLDTVVEHRRTTVDALRRELKSDLDWIILKAMEKDRIRRYETANGLALELERHLRHEPVSARPPSARYRLGRFIGRNKVAVTLASALTVVVLLGLVGTTAGFVRARSAERRAIQEAATAEGALDFMVALFHASDPNEARSGSLTARDILDRGIATIDSLEGQPLVQGRLLQALGGVYTSIGLYDEADTLLRRALAVRQAAMGEGTEELERSIRQLAWLYMNEERFARALPLAQEAVAIAEHVYEPESPLMADALQALGMIERGLAMFDEARLHLDRSLAIREAYFGPDHPTTSFSISQLAWLDQLTGDFESAKAAYERLLPIRAAEYGTDHPVYASTLNDYAVLLKNSADADSAMRLYERVLAIREGALGPDHPDVAAVLENIGITYLEIGSPDKARAPMERALAIQEANLGADHARVAGNLQNVGELYLRLSHYADALAVLDRALAIYERELGPEHPNVGNVLFSQGLVLHRLGDLTTAGTKLARAATLTHETDALNTVALSSVLSLRSHVALDATDTDGAMQYAQQALAALDDRGSTDPMKIGPFLALAEVLLVRSALDSATAVVERRLQFEQRTAEPLDDNMASLLWLRGRIQLAQDATAAADSTLRAALEYERAFHGRGTPQFEFREAAYWALRGDRERALGMLRDAIDSGYNPPLMRYDRRLASLHGEPEFRRLLQRVQAR